MRRSPNATQWLTCLITALLTLSTATIVSAEVPRLFSQQGRLLDGELNPLLGDAELTFTIYNGEGTALWTERQTVTFENGYYSVILGQRAPIPPELFAGEQMELGIAVGDEEEMSPRMAINSVPYALRSAISENAFGEITPSSVSVNG